ncbi:MAG: PRD domain-containing protein [Oscillospiraceae bacterium]|nr:PRD domain-containing protein [Oscillospiraceae bacterium]
MKAIKKINNNVALCVDSNGQELIAFGKGIGFPSMPCEITPAQISMTFYRIDKPFYEMIRELPEKVLETSALIVQKARRTLDSDLNPNLVISLADHINFAIIRMEKYQDIKFPFSFDVEQLYPKETQLGRYAVELVEKNLGAALPPGEVTTIALHFINAEGERRQVKNGAETEKLIEAAARTIENRFSVKIDRASFSYNRFAMHLRYYMKRVRDNEQFHDDNQLLAATLSETYPEARVCAQEIARIIARGEEAETPEDEILYLMIHIQRILQNNRA